MEPFRWLVDVSVIEAFEPSALDLHDFYFTADDYRYQFEPEGKQRFIGHVRERFNSGVVYKKRFLKWDTVIQEKTSELSRYLGDRSNRVDFSEPVTILERPDSWAVRKAILGLTQSQARKRGIGKSTLHYLRMNAHGSKPFSVHPRTREELFSSGMLSGESEK